MEITNDIKETIIQSYNDGKSINYLSKTHKIPKKEISSLLKLNGIIIQKYRHTKYPETMLSEIIPLYEKRDYQSIFELYPELSKENLYYIMSKNKIRTDKEWTSEEINILKENHKLPYKELSVLLPQHSSSAIQLQANRLGYSHRSFWSEEEIEILTKYYSSITIDEICNLLPNRKRQNIIMKAHNLGLKSFSKTLWSEKEKKYIIDNWQVESDYLMALSLHRTERAVKWQREQLGMFRQNRNERNYHRLSDYLRRNTSQWKKDSMANCNYQCIITGSKEFEIHHLIPVNIILNNILKSRNISYKDFPEYSENELNIILSEFTAIQSETLGVCLDVKIHRMFHSLYGNESTPQQFYRFVQDYKADKYCNYK